MYSRQRPRWTNSEHESFEHTSMHILKHPMIYLTVHVNLDIEPIENIHDNVMSHHNYFPGNHIDYRGLILVAHNIEVNFPLPHLTIKKYNFSSIWNLILGRLLSIGFCYITWNESTLCSCVQLDNGSVWNSSLESQNGMRTYASFNALPQAPKEALSVGSAALLLKWNRH